METVLKEVVSRHDGKSPGEFRVLDLGLGRGFSIIPVAVKDGSGRSVPALSPLDVRITLESKKRTGAEALNDLMAAVSSSAGIPVVVFRSFMDGGLVQEGRSPQMFELAAKDEVARDVLNRLLYKVFPGKMAWRLFYQPPPIQSSETTGARGRGLGPGMSTVPPRQSAFFAFSLVPVFRATDSQITPEGRRNIEDVIWENWKPDGTLR